MARQKSLPSTLCPSDLAPRTLILDTGTHTLKAGFSSHLTPTNAPNSTTDCHTIPNVIARSARDKRTYIGPDLLSCADFGELAYRCPVEKGYIVNWESQKAVWERSFFGDADASLGLGCEPAETNLILTEAPNAPVALQRNADEMVFEEFGFGSYYRCIAPILNAYAPSPFPSTTTPPPGTPLECLLVIDAGHSHTTIIPLFHGKPLHPACRRLDIGGKTLTNHLKALISRTFDVHREDHIVGEIKEDVCYVSQDFSSDLERVWRGGIHDRRQVDPSIVVDYVLPDYETIKRGFARPHDTSGTNLRNRALGIGTEGGRREHVLTIGNERFVVPELLFTPSDIGMPQAGLAPTILDSLSSLPAGLRQAYLANVLVAGGTSLLPGFVERLEGELKGCVEEEVVVRVGRAQDAVKNSWLGGARLATDGGVLRSHVVTKQEYEENGEGWVRRRFAGKVGR